MGRQVTTGEANAADKSASSEQSVVHLRTWRSGLGPPPLDRFPGARAMVISIRTAQDAGSAVVDEFLARLPQLAAKTRGWVAAGSYPPAAPTVPGVPHSGTRLLR